MAAAYTSFVNNIGFDATLKFTGPAESIANQGWENYRNKEGFVHVTSEDLRHYLPDDFVIKSHRIYVLTGSPTAALRLATTKDDGSADIVLLIPEDAVSRAKRT